MLNHYQVSVAFIRAEEAAPGLFGGHITAQHSTSRIGNPIYYGGFAKRRPKAENLSNEDENLLTFKRVQPLSFYMRGRMSTNDPHQ